MLVIYVLMAGISFLYWRHSVGQLFWVSRESILVHHEYWRLLTALFTHSDLPHLLSNTPLFLIFGWFLRGFYGNYAFPVMAFVVGVVTNLLTVYFYPDSTRLVGASGMVHGMVSMWLVLYVRHDSDRPLIYRWGRAIAFALVVMFPSTFRPTTSYLAHAIGFGLGFLPGVFLRITPEHKETILDPQLHASDSRISAQAQSPYETYDPRH